MPNQSSFIVAFAIAFFVLAADTLAQETEISKPLHVMSFNIRLGVADDGPDHWEKRKEMVARTITNFGADLIGTQETWDFQAEFLSGKLADHTYVGRSRQSDNKGEHCGILFRTSRFDKLIEGHFWLSETPDQPGSKSWDSSLPRMATWLKLWDRENKLSFYIINTHFDHRGKTARSESAKLIRKFIGTLPNASSVIVTGDFNAGEGSGPYQSLFAEMNNENSPVVDTFRVIQPEKGSEEGTFGGFKGSTSGARIDWVACTRDFHVKDAAIDRSSFEGRYPSDHYPVTATLQFGESIKSK